ncbi:hypothetical protein SADUNF_Sadunf10G0047000 [Salix dunnii]|uniref:Uncharacterized protein n=1 Tax=Salix dunnii TaxID=1413687 RepID=A0A835MXY5_9ROSI|nr:hypothetical protein SADUNF_Sadunf10G0047000 [Salix dunnii]
MFRMKIVFHSLAIPLPFSQSPLPIASAWAERHDKEGTIELRSKEECSFQPDQTRGPSQEQTIRIIKKTFANEFNS